MNAVLHGAINDSNGMTAIVKSQESQLQKFFIGRGNNDGAVRSVLKQRAQWVQGAEESLEEAAFVWTQWKKQRHIDFLASYGGNAEGKPIKLYGKMEQNKQLTNKKGVYVNMRGYYEAVGQDPF